MGRTNGYYYKPLNIWRAIRRVLSEGDECTTLIALALNISNAEAGMKLQQLRSKGFVERVPSSDHSEFDHWRLTELGATKARTETPAMLGAEARRNKRKTHCKLGHRMSYDTDGHWRCLVCKKARDTNEVRRNYFREYARNRRKRLRDEANIVDNGRSPDRNHTVAGPDRSKIDHRDYTRRHIQPA